MTTRKVGIWLAMRDKFVTAGEIAKGLGIKEGNVRALLYHMVRDGQAIRGDMDAHGCRLYTASMTPPPPPDYMPKSSPRRRNTVMPMGSGTLLGMHWRGSQP